MSIEQRSNELREELSFNRLINLKHFLKSHQSIIPFILMIIILVLPLNLFIIKQLINKFSPNPKTQNPPLVSVEKILNGSLQKEYETWFNNHNPMKSMFTNFNNQFYYSLFSKSLMFDSNIVIGKNAYLFEKIYINQYVNLSKIPYTQKQFDLWAADLQELADFFAKRGQKLIYLITPSKASFYPEYLPDSYAKIIKDTRPDYFLKIEALKKVRVPYFDASQFILANKDKSYGYLLFPQGGTHWTMLGASLVAQRILDLIAQQTQTQLPPLSYSYTITTRPLGVDKDLLHLCKLLFPPKHYSVPFVSFKKNKNPVPLKVAIIGGSFTHFFKQLFTESQYFSQLDHYYYLILNHYQTSKNGKKELPINREDPSSYQDILAADVVILEENEILPYSNHFRELYFRLLGKSPSS
jgi:alginate O-acetyltransferase complex protein AlgJ